MMKYGLAALLTCICLSTFADVDKSKVLVQQRVQANYGVGCNIAAIVPQSTDGGLGSDPETGMGGLAVNPLPKNWKSRLDSLGFNLYCKSSEDPIVNSRLAQQNPKTGVWEKDLEKWFGKLTPEERRVLDKATRVFNLKAPNSSGYAFTEEATTGDEFGRERRMIFCLFHPPKAICGGGVVGVLRDGSKGDLTQHALKIIQSIEFLPDVKPLDATPASSSGGDAHQ